jgi:hypothetical protein
VSEEAKANTFDLVQLTRLTAFRIITGKWLALVAQTLLLVTSVLPYAVLRYYFGGVDVLTDLNVIASLLTLSAVLTAGAIALSTALVAVRLIVLVAAIPLVTTGIGFFSIARAFGGPRGMVVMGAGSGDSWWFIIVAALVYVFVFLEFAASKIAPVVENHSARKRCGALLIGVICMLVAALGDHDVLGMAVFFAVPLLAWIVIDALTEVPSALPATYAPFGKRGLVGRVAGRVLYPGWGTGVIFTGLIIGMMFAAFEITRLTASIPVPEAKLDEYYAFWPLLFFALISPLPVMFIFPRVRQRFWLYVLVQLVFALCFVAATFAAEGMQGRSEGPYHLLAFLPPSALIAMEARSGDWNLAGYYGTRTIIAGLVILGFLFVQMFRDFRFMSYLERSALKEEAPSS